MLETKQLNLLLEELKSIILNPSIQFDLMLNPIGIQLPSFIGSDFKIHSLEGGYKQYLKSKVDALKTFDEKINFISDSSYRKASEQNLDVLCFLNETQELIVNKELALSYYTEEELTAKLSTDEGVDEVFQKDENIFGMNHFITVIIDELKTKDVLVYRLPILVKEIIEQEKAFNIQELGEWIVIEQKEGNIDIPFLKHKDKYFTSSSLIL